MTVQRQTLEILQWKTTPNIMTLRAEKPTGPVTGVISELQTPVALAICLITFYGENLQVSAITYPIIDGDLICSHNIRMFSTKSVHDAVTERSPAYAILGIDSEDRFKDYVAARAAGPDAYNVSPYDFQITKNESMMNGFFTRLALTEVNFPWVIPNINATTSSIIFNWQVGAGPLNTATITLDVGFYTPAEIAATIEAKVLALAPVDLSGFSMEYGVGDVNTVSLPLFSASTPLVTQQFSFAPLPYNSTVYPFPSTTKQLFDLLGFGDINMTLDDSQGGAATYCQGSRYIDIVCSQLTYNQALKDTMSQATARDTLCRLYLGDGPYTGTSTMDPSDPAFCPPGCAPFTIYRQFTNPKFIRWLPNQPVQGNLRFTVYDENGIALNELLASDLYYKTANWSMTLLVSED